MTIGICDKGDGAEDNNLGRAMGTSQPAHFLTRPPIVARNIPHTTSKQVSKQASKQLNPNPKKLKSYWAHCRAIAI